MSTMGERIRLIREELRFKQEEFANHFGVSRAFISAIEKDKSKFSVDNLCKLLVDFDVNINYVLADKGNMFNSAPENISSDFKDEIIKTVEEYLKTRDI